MWRPWRSLQPMSLALLTFGEQDDCGREAVKAVCANSCPVTLPLLLCMLVASCSALLLTVSHCRINNAGSNAYKHRSLLEASDADLVSIVETNMLGVMLGCREVSAPASACLSFVPSRPMQVVGTRHANAASRRVLVSLKTLCASIVEVVSWALLPTITNGGGPQDCIMIVVC